jgi:hypothetical protein
MTRWFAIRTAIDGYSFASKAEAKRYVELKLLQQAGAIRHLRLQPRYPLHVVDTRGLAAHIGDYIADFEYEEPDDLVVTEDVKGARTAIFIWKAKHFALEYGRPVREISR